MHDQNEVSCDLLLYDLIYCFVIRLQFDWIFQETQNGEMGGSAIGVWGVGIRGLDRVSEVEDCGELWLTVVFELPGDTKC